MRTDNQQRHSLASPSDHATEDPTPSSHVKSLNSPTLERTRDPIPCHMNIENVLSWPVFEDENPSLDLKNLLNDSNDVSSQFPPMFSEVDHYPDEQLVQRFLDHVFIFNPVLEEAKVHKYLRDARFTGLGWDAQSCLLVLMRMQLTLCYAYLFSCSYTLMDHLLAQSNHVHHQTHPKLDGSPTSDRQNRSSQLLKGG